ncbi:hypothetical protein BV898_19572 [Hypsibius exemplaris]|uniref:Uncharacterized protein n=1 Tax=Hypsibius exemplaris TaxID=2072580 RepID=A0A9X6NJ73_HYPEX|nr:hypothetical protein BV898_19572 [Hypsibius exemplaris]
MSATFKIGTGEVRPTILCKKVRSHFKFGGTNPKQAKPSACPYARSEESLVRCGSTVTWPAAPSAGETIGG